MDAGQFAEAEARGGIGAPRADDEGMHAQPRGERLQTLTLARVCAAKARRRDKFIMNKLPLGLREDSETGPIAVPSQNWLTAWNGVCRDIFRQSQLVRSSYNASLSSVRKAVSVVSREVRRRALKNFRGLREASQRARRLVREMQSYWRRHEREVADTRKRSAKEADDRLRQEEEEREAKRQQKKLDFLLTQTELYSHFIGKKMGLLPAEQPEHGGSDGAKAEDEDAEDADERKKTIEEARVVTYQKIREGREKLVQFDAETGRGAQAKAQGACLRWQLSVCSCMR